MDRIRIGDILMAHFAQLDENDIVTNVIVVHNNELLDDLGYESEEKGIDFCVAHFGGRWIQTSYNAKFRCHFAGIGYTYDEIWDTFIPPKCHDEAILNNEAAVWNCENEEHYAVS
jgi:hypothetical protein